VAQAIRASRGAVMDDRLVEAVDTALRKELIDRETSRKIKKEFHG
jgi:hypothetical protein